MKQFKSIDQYRFWTPFSRQNDIREFGEKCGIVGVYTSDESAPSLTRRASVALQHRGQESSGMTVWNGKSLKSHLGMGLIPHVLTESVMKDLGGAHMALAHNRYSTTGESTLTNCQPVALTLGKYQISIGHNGNIPADITDLKERLTMKIEATTDTALVAAILLQERPHYSSWQETIEAVLSTIPAAYSFVILTEDGNLFGARDIYGIRPFVLGKFPVSRFQSPISKEKGGLAPRILGEVGWIIASETVALDAAGAEFMREIHRGEIVRIDSQGNLHSSFFGKAKKQQACVFEKIYFSRPDSFQSGIRIREAREETGRRLARRMKKKGLKFDMVIPIFDSGYPAAKGAALELGVPLKESITTSHYVGRTFIQPGQARREAAVGSKHNLSPDGLFGKKVLFVDDSAVRLTTSRSLVTGIRNSGAVSVSAGFASPPVVNHDDMGIDMKSKSELPASQWDKEGIDGIEKHAAELIGADSVTYLPIEDVAEANGLTTKDLYYFPFGGPHPVRDDQYSFSSMKRTVSDIPKLMIFISGQGSNMENIFTAIDRKELQANVIGVVSNKADAPGLTRARAHQIPSIVFESKGKMKDEALRKQLEQEILSFIESEKPDMIVLAGWMMLLSDDFLKSLQKMEVPVVNLHPALLGGIKNHESLRQYSGQVGIRRNADSGLLSVTRMTSEEFVNTSRGRIPVIKGMLPDVIDEVFAKKLLVSGVTVHQVLPGDFDAGPIILTEEVRRYPEETKEEFEKRIHEAEYRVFPAAIARALHVMKQGIDISHGTFPW